ncbi:hypothetical protein JCM11641_004999 [Rhodosporidiobolus odoratus]
MARTSNATTSSPSQNALTPLMAKKIKSNRTLAGDEDQDMVTLLNVRSTSTSLAWQGYSEPKPRPDLKRGEADENGHRALMVELLCITCGVSKFRRINDTNLSNLVTPTKSCKEVQKALTVSRSLNELDFAPDEASKEELLQQWVVECAVNARPFRFIKDKESETPADAILFGMHETSSLKTTQHDLIERTARATRVADFKNGRNVRKDPQAFWAAKEFEAGGMGDKLAEMAVDVFECPAASVDAERSFSHGRRVVSEFQHPLSPRRISSLLVVASYSKYAIIKPGLLSMRRKERARADNKRRAQARATKAAAEKAAVEEVIEDTEVETDEDEQVPGQPARKKRRLTATTSMASLH